MAEKLWHFLINSFLVATATSFRAMRKIGNFTLNALNIPSNAPIFVLYMRLLPFVSDYNGKYTTWLNSLGVEESSNNSVYVEFQLVSSTYIRDWDIAIQAVYNIKTTIYKSLLHDRRKPFQTGSYGDKLAALQALALALVGVTGLSAVLADVNAKVGVIQGLMNTASTHKSGASTASTNLETARGLLGIELYGILGQLMDYFRSTPASVADYFDITALRRLEQTIWRRAVKASKTVYIFTRTLLPTDQLHLVNLNLTTLRFSFLATKNGVITVNFIDVPPLSSVSVLRKDIGDMANRFCVVQNLSTTGSGKYMLVLV